MKRFFLLLPLLLACSQPADEEPVDQSEAAVSSARLEKSRIEVFLDQKNETSSVSGECTIASTKFRITYENATLPAGTKLTLHVGENAGGQDYVGDGFGWSSWRELHWQNVRDLAMPKSGSIYSVEVEGHPYGRMFENWNAYPFAGQWESQTFGATIQFAFRLDLPDGTVLWDNRLRRDYG